MRILIKYTNTAPIHSIRIFFLLILLCSSQLYGQTAPVDSTTNDRGIMANCANGASAVASTNPVCSGSTTDLSISGEPAGFHTYAWEKSTTSAVAGFAAIAGATSSTYTTLAITVPTWYRCLVSPFCCGSCVASYTAVVAITVNALPTTSAAGGDQSVCATTATMAGNSPAAGETGAWTLISGSGTITTSSSATSGITALAPGSSTFRWTITKTATGCTTTDDVILTNGDFSSSLAYASSNCPASTTSALLTLDATPTSIKWQQNDNGAGYADIAGATTNPYAASMTAGHTYTYRAIATTTCGTYTITAASTTTSYSMIDYTGGLPDYATANAAGHCYNNLTAGQKYCFAFIYFDYIEMDWLTNGCSGSCPAYQYTKLFSGGSSVATSTSCGGSVSATVSGNCAETTVNCGTSCDPTMYDNACGVVQTNGMQFGSGCAAPAMTQGNVYYICFTVPAGCGGMSICPQNHCETTNCSATPLPIKLLYFDAVALKGQVQLHWVTETEINNDYFTIERTTDGKTFTLVKEVDGAGNSSSVLSYSAVDESPLKGISYYRLRQTDFNGKVGYSKLASVDIASDSPLKLMYVVPNQNNNNIQYQFSYTRNNPLVVEVFDIVGKKIISQQLSSEENAQTLNLDASGLSKGVYLLKISDGIYSEVKKFVY